VTSLLIIVPARSGSKRLPGKNLRNLAGRTLLAYTAQAISDAGLDAPVFLTTDDRAMAKEGKRLGWLVPFLRPPELAKDDTPMFDSVLHALNSYVGESGSDPDMVLLLQPTSPLRGGDCLRVAVDLLKARNDANAVVGMVAVNIPPARLYFTSADGTGEALSEDARHPVYVPNGAVYLVRTTALREYASFYPPRMLSLEMDPLNSIDIDSPSDWQLAEAVIARGFAPKRPSLARKSIEGSAG
jgi:CMP-N,N'-diacetyllegionaminic acid synthase